MKPSKTGYLQIIYFLLTFLSLGFTAAGQESSPQKGIFFVEPEIMIGTVVPNFPDFPKSDIRTSLVLNFGRLNAIENQHWATYYSYPTTGIAFAVSDYANNKVLGREFSLVPYLTLNLSKKRLHSWYLKLGLGASYFTKHFDVLENPTNEVIGSSLTWTFQAFMYRSLLVNEKMHLKFGGGFWHSSNGHTQLPNFGMNSAMMSISAQFLDGAKALNFYKHNKPVDIDRTKHYYFVARKGYGFHELGDANGPIGGAKKSVYTLSLGAGVLYRQHLRVRAGFAYRFYQHYYDEIRANERSEFRDRPAWNASNIYFFLGSEFLIGHIGMDAEGGLNLFKPFFRTHIDEFTNTEDETKIFLKQMFSTRLGLNFYLFNTNRKPRNNFFLGAHINANFGQADFTEINLGYTHMFK
ncbi:acyloxyacyl hydrolase [Fulvivirgaceae bacterium BMA10]|uniref:Acyloxyacyl hydrolase n=1 Tax=Splendidivirga corallicola TaxID=3051826 RepID=A0ABT8KQQ7_9BACT|nr:acyloxyacyl hydrolase [Fulvivirgaceae bacterium BMA10]